MCLYTDEETARLSENDIVCYKVVRHVHCDNRYVLSSEYYGFKYNVGKSYLCYDFRTGARHSIMWRDNCNCVVEHGFHSYITLDKALSHAESMFNNSTVVIMKCIIPKGTLMFSSADYSEYCSERIKVIGYESFANVAKAMFKHRADSIKWKETLKNGKEHKCTESDTKHMSGIRKIIKAFKSWMSHG